MIQRYVPAALCGMLVTLALFFLMHAMIATDTAGINKSDKLRMVEFVRLHRDNQAETQKRRTLPEKPPPKKRPPPPELEMSQAQKSPLTKLAIDLPKLDIPVRTERFNGSLIQGIQIGPNETPIPSNSGVQVSGEVIPLVRIEPRYPARATRRRIEGWVKVRFTITTTGTVRDPEIVESRPARVFNDTVIRAIRKWKFKPKLVDGKPVEQIGIQTLRFKLR